MKQRFTQGEGLPRRIGVISDTHGLLRPQAVDALRGVEHIIHAGDICGVEILEQLRKLAPVTAVRGNNDRGPWAQNIPERVKLELGGVRIYVLHDLKELDVEPADFQVVIAGHSHQPRVEMRDGVLFLNPDSAGPRRFTLPVSVGFLEITAGAVSASIQELHISAAVTRGD